MIDPDQLHRTVKLEMDSGRAKDVEDAERIVRGYVLQVHVGRGVAGSQTRQAALLTVVNAGSRAFLGGVLVKIDEDFRVTTAWDHGRWTTETLADFDNVSFVDELDRNRPAIVIGDADCDAELPLYPTWEGWAAGVVPSPGERLAERAEFALAGVLSGALAVSEAFQWTRGYRVAAARSVGLSLWGTRPQLEAPGRCRPAAGLPAGQLLASRSRPPRAGLRLGDGLPTVRIGPREVRYRPEDIEAWIARRTFLAAARNSI